MDVIRGSLVGWSPLVGRCVMSDQCEHAGRDPADRHVSKVRGIQKSAETFAHFALHYPIPEWGGLISGLAFPMVPAHVSRGEVFRFNLNHVVTPEDPMDMVRTELIEVGA